VRLFFVGLLCLPACGSTSLALNELVATHNETSDWFEIYNYGPYDLVLEGWSVVDNIEENEPWLFPSGTMEAGGFLQIWADDEQGAEDGFHVNFKLSKEGESLYLLGPSGRIEDEVDFPSLETGETYGRHPDGTGPWSISEFLTPNISNE